MSFLRHKQEELENRAILKIASEVILGKFWVYLLSLLEVDLT